MSVGYEFATIDVDLLVHPKAITAGVEAMGLWLWGMVWSHKTGANGKLPRHVVRTAWGSKSSSVDRLAKRLVDAGLWLMTEEGWEIWNYGKKNQSAEEKERRRALGRERMRRLRDGKRRAPSGDAGDASRDAPCDAHVHDESAAPDLICNEVIKTRAVLEGGSAEGGAPSWFPGSVAAAEQALGGPPIDSVPARWLEYSASRERKGWAMNHKDAVGWLLAVIRSEREKAKSQRTAPRNAAEITKQPYDANAPWMKVGT